MSLEEQHLLEFGEYSLDLEEKLLRRGETVVPITPKVFDTLQALVQNPGRLIDKDHLIQLIWQDRFVEDSNLSFNIKMLRKALGDSASAPRFIETVPRRGYRFIAEVRKSQNGSPPDIAVVVPERSDANKVASARMVLVPGAVIIVLASITAAVWYSSRRSAEHEAPILTAAFLSEKLSADGGAMSASMSADGRLVAYTYNADGRESVWVRDLETSNNVQIIPPSDNQYFDLEFSPDGRSLYFARIERPWPAAVQPDIYRISTIGGTPTKIVAQAQGSVSVSSDGAKISFRRCPYTDDEYCSLWIADSDGKNERRLLSRPRPIRIGDMAISPDGKTVAFGTGQSRNGSQDFGLAAIDVQSGVERELTKEKFFDIWGVSWLPDGQGLLITAKKFAETTFRIWTVSDTGKAAVRTNDAESYLTASLNNSATAMVCVTLRADFHLRVYSSRLDGMKPRAIADAETVAFAPDGKIIFSSAMTGNFEVSTISIDGTSQRQLTNDPGMNLNGIASTDGNHIFFISNRSGKVQVWRMNRDGTDQRQLTHNDGISPLGTSPDGRWLYFLSGRERRLMRISSQGGDEETVWDRPFETNLALSRDAELLAYSGSQNGMTSIHIVSLRDKRTIRSFQIPSDKTGIVQSSWSNEGRAIYYATQDQELRNYYVWKQDVGGGAPVKMADLGPEPLREPRAFAVSPDETSFAVIQGSWKRDAVLLKGLR